MSDEIDSVRKPGHPSRLLASLTRPAILVGALSLATVVGLYWFVATRPGVNPARQSGAKGGTSVPQQAR